MAKRYAILLFTIILSTQLKAQQFGLFNTKTLFDSFENPAQKAFVLDSSRQYASNFFFPGLGLDVANKGDSNFALRSLINRGKFNGVYDASGIPIGEFKRNEAYLASNTYLLTFRLFKSYKYHQELGFSWQVRADAYANYSNETLVAVDNYNRFEGDQIGIFNGKAYGQSYHQFSVTYRENYDKRLSFGAKLSLLSGITYNNANITGSSITVDPAVGQLRIGMSGTYKTNFYGDDEIGSKTLVPNFRNPGLSAGFGTTYKSKTGYFIMANVKDLGFIRWSKNAHQIVVNDGEIIVDRTNNDQKNLQRQLSDLLEENDIRKAFYTPTNAKADFLLSKTFQYYSPNFIVSKNLFYTGGHVALANTFKFNELSATLTPAYNLLGFGMLGLQGMYQTPNFEFYLGTDNLLRTTAIRQSVNVTTGYTGASVYMGMAIKFGYVVEHPQNSSFMPGVGEEANKNGGFFAKIFGIFKKK
jgi:hypothetical protein